MEQNPELQKLLKLKEALKSDYEKKTGKKIEPKEEKKKQNSTLRRAQKAYCQRCKSALAPGRDPNSPGYRKELYGGSRPEII